jgi:hypothetical protein
VPAAAVESNHYFGQNVNGRASLLHEKKKYITVYESNVESIITSGRMSIAARACEQ